MAATLKQLKLFFLLYTNLPGEGKKKSNKPYSAAPNVCALTIIGFITQSEGMFWEFNWIHPLLVECQKGHFPKHFFMSLE